MRKNGRKRIERKKGSKTHYSLITGQFNINKTYTKKEKS